MTFWLLIPDVEQVGVRWRLKVEGVGLLDRKFEEF